MGIITREGTAPIEDGETGSAADVENEFAKLFPLVNGELDTNNISGSAGILGTQLANNTVAETQIVASTITTASMAASAVTKSNFSAALNAAGAMTSSTSFVDVPSISTITLTPGSTSDIVVMELQITSEALLSGDSTMRWGFNINDGTGDVESGFTRNEQTRPETHTIRHAMTATSASSTIYKAIYRFHAGTASNSGWYDATGTFNTLFTVTIYPIK